MKKIFVSMFDPLYRALFRFMVSQGMILCVVDGGDNDHVDPDADPVDLDADPVDPDADPVDPDADPVDPDADPIDPEPAQATRGQARIQKLANERAEALAEARALREQAEFYKRQAEQLQQQRQPAPQDDVYRDPDEVWRQQTEAKVNQALFSATDLNDKAAYNLKASQNPIYAKYSDRVEKHLADARAKGQNATREGVLKYLVGEDAVNNVGKKTPAANEAQKRVAAAKAKPVSGGSNVSPPRSDKSLEERLSGLIL